MSTPILGLPVIGPLHPVEWVRPAGNTEMKVTQTAAQHAAKTIGGVPRAKALDIGDGAPDLDTLFAPHGGVVAQALTVGSANLSIDFDHDGVKWRIVMAHNTLPHPVKVGQVLAEGAVVGRMGHTSIPSMPVALHLHIQVGWWNGSAFIWVDPWPLFRQNQPVGGNMPSFKPGGPFIGKFTFGGPGHSLISTNDTKVHYPTWPGGSMTLDVVASLDLKTPVGIPVDIEGNSPPLNKRDQVFLVDAPGFGASAYALRSDGTFAPTLTDSTAAVKKAVDALTSAYDARIAGIKTKVATNAADVADD